MKQGILHDYDLMANAEKSAQKGNICVVCGDFPVRYQWSDYSGEAMCMTCGVNYQLKWGSEAQEKEGAYPYLNLRDNWVPIVKEYYQETKKWTCFGMMLGDKPGLREFFSWVEKKHPEMMTEDKSDA